MILIAQLEVNPLDRPSLPMTSTLTSAKLTFFLVLLHHSMSIRKTHLYNKKVTKYSGKAEHLCSGDEEKQLPENVLKPNRNK